MNAMRRCVAWLLVFLLVVSAMPGVAWAASPPLDSADCWECRGPGLPDPCRNTLYDVAIVPGTGGAQAWAVGDMGTILHLSGGVWTKSPCPTTKRLYGVAAARSDLALAVGKDGAALKWDGVQWTELSFNTDNYIRTVEFTPGTDGAQGWAAGDKYGVGIFYYWDGSRFQSKYNNDIKYFGGEVWDIDLLDSASGFGAGHYIGEGYGWRWSDEDWRGTELPEDDLWGVAAVATNDVWAAGEEGSLYHFDGASWTKWGASPAEETLYDVELVTSASGWAVGEDGEMLKWDGASWTQVYSGVQQDLRAVALEGTAYGWAVGEGGVILHWNGASWIKVAVPFTTHWDDLAITPGSGGSDMWAVGSGRELLHYDGATWQLVQGPSNVFGYYAVSMVNANDGWAAGSGGKMVHWDGASWTLIADVESSAALVATASNNIWGFGWSRIMHWDGGGWSEVPCPVNETFYGADMLSATDIWACGDDGAVVRWDGATWHDLTIDYEYVLWDIGMASAGEGYATGSFGNLFRWDGGSWGQVSHGVTDDAIRAVDVIESSAGTVGWAMADYGQPMRYEGGTWSMGCSPTGNSIHRVDHTSPYEAWAVGDQGVILHWVDPDQPSMEPQVYLPMLSR